MARVIRIGSLQLGSMTCFYHVHPTSSAFVKQAHEKHDILMQWFRLASCHPVESHSEQQFSQDADKHLYVRHFRTFNI